MRESSYRLLMAYNREVKKLDDLYRNAAKRCGMSECAFWILYTLRVERTSFTQSEICDFLREPKQTVNSALKKLEAEGYLTLAANADQRRKTIRLTDAGERLAAESVDRIASAEAGALCAMPPEDRDAFIRLTGQYRRLLEAQLRQEKNQSESGEDTASADMREQK